MLEGREAGTRGYDIAANYVATHFKLIGLQPAGTHGYFQPVPLRRSVLRPGLSLQVRTSRGTQTFSDSDHVAARPSMTEAEQRVEADCVFAGYGIVAPELRRDDYARLDVRDKIVVVLGGPAPGLPSEVAAHLGDAAEQRARAAERGAIGVFIVYTPALEARWPFAKLPEIYRQPQFDWSDADVKQDAQSRLRVAALVDTTAEEKGLIGSDYFARKPTLARERLVGVINLDGAMPFFDLIDVISYGAASSTLGQTLARAASSLGISVSPDPAPEQAYFTRSDHYPCVRQGVPGIFLIAGDARTPDGKDAGAISRRWAEQHLHQPSDDLNQPFHDPHLEKWAQLYWRWTVETANAPESPLWYAGDFFGNRYAPGARKASR